MYDHIPATSADGVVAHAQRLGGQEPVRVPTIDCHPPNGSCLATSAMRGLLLELNGHGVIPSSTMTSGLMAAAETLEAMARQTLPPCVHLSSLDPGTGKTTLIRHFISGLLGGSDYEEVAVLVCLSQLVEVEKMQASLRELGIEVGICTGSKEVNDKATIPPSDARVLLTTQAKLVASACHHDHFRDMRGFHYLGEPRQVRIWDESLLPGEEVQLCADDLSGLLGHFRRPAPKLCGKLEDLRGQLEQAASGDVLHVPDLEEMAGKEGLAEVRRLQRSEGFSGLERTQLQRLEQACGSDLRVHRSNYGEVSLCGYRETLPPDLAPLLVLDASGRCRQTYELWTHQTGSLVRLPSAVKDYSRLQIHLLGKGSSKAAHAVDRKEVLLRSIAGAITTRPDEDWLIVVHKGLMPHFRNRLEAHLGGGVTGQLHFLTWGCHHGTNDFAHVPNVILASLLFLPPEIYEVRVRLCAGMEQTAAVSEAARRAMTVGELLHDILQALCRAKVRGVDVDGNSPPCRAWIIAASQWRLRDHLPKLFPGCQLEDWRPKGVSKLSGRIRQVLEHIDQMDDEGFGDEFTFPELADELEMTRRDFRKQIAKDPRFREEIGDRGYEEVDIERQTSKGPRTAKGIQRMAPVFPVDPAAHFSILDHD